jgi:hypothetical protein
MFEVGKTYKTRDGREAKVVHVFEDGTVLVVHGDLYWRALSSGHLDKRDKCGADLMPPRRELWVVFRPDREPDYYWHSHPAEVAGRAGFKVTHFIESEDQP